MTLFPFNIFYLFMFTSPATEFGRGHKLMPMPLTISPGPIYDFKSDFLLKLLDTPVGKSDLRGPHQ